LLSLTKIHELLFQGKNHWQGGARKRNRKEVIARYAKSKINIGKEHDRWMSLKDSVQMK
jgi:hypothetical protein